jgi:hypothetical protein
MLRMRLCLAQVFVPSNIVLALTLKMGWNGRCIQPLVADAKASGKPRVYERYTITKSSRGFYMHPDLFTSLLNPPKPCVVLDIFSIEFL